MTENIAINTKTEIKMKKLTTFLFIGMILASFSLKTSDSCTTNEFQCNKSKFCLPLRFRCDGDEDCGMGDKSDEGNCSSITKACSDNNFRCDNGKCIAWFYTCDTENDCGDSSDERACVELENDCAGMFRCLNGACLSTQYQCDGRKQCSDGSDELYCGQPLCTGIYCYDSGECLDNKFAKRCDFQYDCGDKTDEIDCPAIAKVRDVNRFLTVAISENCTAKWAINITSNADKLITKWKGPGNNEIVFGTGKYKISLTKIPIYAWATYEIIFQITDVTREDEGLYPLQVEVNSTIILEENFHLKVEASKIVQVESIGNQINFLEDQSYSLTCKSPEFSNPQWTFQMCNSRTYCSSPTKVNETGREKVGKLVISTLQFKASNHGVYRCSTDKPGNIVQGQNFENTDIKKIRVVDFPGNDIISIDKPNEIIEGNDVLVNCSISNLYTNEHPRWYTMTSNGHLSVLTNSTGRNLFGDRTYEIIEETSKWSFKSILKFDRIRQQSSLQLGCMSGDSPDEFFATMQLTVLRAVKPTFLQTNLKDTSVIIMAGNDFKLFCNVTGRPKPQIFWTWEMQLISKWSSAINYTLTKDNSILILYNVSKVVEGKFECTARNRIGEASAFSNILVNDKALPEFVYTNLRNTTMSLKLTDTVDLICNVTGRPKPNVRWFWNNFSRSNWPSIIQIPRHASYISEQVLPLQFLHEEGQGQFMCLVENKYGSISAYVNISIQTDHPKCHYVNGTLSIPFYARKKSMPQFVYTNLQNSTILLNSTDALDLICDITGHPRPVVTWFWNNISRSEWPSSLRNSRHARFISDEVFALLSPSEYIEGQYMCVAENEYGLISAYADVLIEPTSTSFEKIPLEKYLWAAVSLGIVSAVLLLVFGAFVVRYKLKQKKLNTFLNGIYKKEFYDGQIENINPELSVSDQANLLPFQLNTWEIPRERLKLGIILGSGAFGLVFKAQAYQVVEDGMATEVAVKTVKANADESHFKALMTELKIMAHLGKNLNIVNLIGACTKNLVKKRELLIVMEFCKYGSLQTYMIRNKISFLDQLDPKTDKIDPSISVQNKQSSYNTDSTGRHVEVSNGTFLESYKGDYNPSDTQPISSTDLLSWAFQVAKGMEYLSSRKVLHGDLAARNVLLSENNIVKICDFGYARETFKNYNYKKDTKGVLLPIKWMAIESIYCGIFSSMSDCWSFGVFLWELFSLGNKPYPGLEVNEGFCERINDGYRMDKPQYAPISVYCIMLDCWAHEPTYRPSFSQLSDKLGGLVSSWLRNRILDMNEGYARLNQENKIVGEGGDYLMKMGQAEVSIQVGPKVDTNLPAPIPDRYQEIPSPFTTFGTEPACDIAVNKRNSQCRFFKPRPPQPPPRRIFE